MKKSVKCWLKGYSRNSYMGRGTEYDISNDGGGVLGDNKCVCGGGHQYIILMGGGVFAD